MHYLDNHRGTIFKVIDHTLQSILHYPDIQEKTLYKNRGFNDCLPYEKRSYFINMIPALLKSEGSSTKFISHSSLHFSRTYLECFTAAYKNITSIPARRAI